MVNYNRELRMRMDIRRKEKVEKAMEFVETMKKIQKEAIVLHEKYRRI